MAEPPHFCYAITLSESTPESEFVLLCSSLKKAHLSYELSNKLAPKRLILVYIEDFKSLLQEADNLNFEKQKTSKRSLNTEYVETLPKDKYYYFIKQREHLNPVITKLESSSCFKFRIRHKFLPKDADLDDYKTIAETLLEPQEFIRTVNFMLNRMELEGDQHQRSGLNLLESFRSQKYIEDMTPLHNYEETVHRKNLYNDQYIKSYFGEHVSVYFKFLAYLQKWLLVPTLVGVFIFLLGLVSNTSVTSSPYESFYSIFIIIWGNLFLVFWEKRENQIGFSWKCFGKSFETQEVLQNSLESFHERVNDVTGLNEKYYPTYKRFFRYLISALISLPILFLTFVVLMLSLNMRGFVIPEHETIFVKSLSDLAGPGQIFDKTTKKILLPTILHVILVSLLNKSYKAVSEWSSKHEFHRTYLEYENSLIVKRFIFEMFNTFTDFIYIGFIRLDIEGLKKVLIALFMVDEFRRVIIETVIPLIKQKAQLKSFKKKTEDAKEDKEQNKSLKVLELNLNQYESFDDYLEVIVNFGYVVLFASATPLAPLFIYVFHWIESYSDRFKIFNLYRRPLPTRAKNIGSWKPVLTIMGLLSVVTNIFLFSFSSNQMFSILGIEKREELVKYIFGIVFVLEHILFVVIWVLRKFVMAKGDWTHTYWERKTYKTKVTKFKRSASGLGQTQVQS